MDKKIFQVYLAKRDVPDSEAYAQLDLPARPWELIDALDKVRLAGDETLFLEIEDYYDYEELVPHLADEVISLNELNALAQSLSELSMGQHTAFDGLLQMEVDKRTGPISVQTLRNLAASADCCHVVGEALNDSQLGRFYAENGFIPEIETLSDKVFEMLDFEAIGRKMRLGDCGVFTPHGYVAQNADLELTSPVPADVPVPNYSILLRVSKGYFNDPAYDNDKTVLLKLPAGPDQADAVVEELGAASWKELGWRCLTAAFPHWQMPSLTRRTFPQSICWQKN